MSSEVIKQLQEAVQFSPENVPLRMHLAQVLLQDYEYTAAEEQYRKVLELSSSNTAAQLGLARTFYHSRNIPLPSLYWNNWKAGSRIISMRCCCIAASS